MRKLLLIFALILLVGCASKPQANQTDNPVQDNKADNIVKAYSPAVSALLVNKDANNIYYKFDLGGANPAEYNIWISGDKMKIVLPPYKDFFKYYDTIYANSASKTAVAYCYNLDNRLCREKEGPYDLNYADVSTKTPYMWINEIPPEAQVTASEQIEKRDVAVVEYGNTKMWIDKFYKIPLRVVSDGMTWNYELITSGNIQDKDVDAPSS